MMIPTIFTPRQLTESLFYIPQHGNFPYPSGIYQGELEANHSEQNAVLLEPLASALLFNKPLLDDVWCLSRKKRVEQLLILCRVWLNAEQDCLIDAFGVDQIKEFDEKLMCIIMHELDELYKCWQIRVRMPIEQKEGFLPFFLNMVIAGSIIYDKSKQWSNTKQVATDIVKYLHEEGESFPLDEIVFNFIKDDRKLYEDYVIYELKQLAQRESNEHIYINESTEWLSNQHRLEVIENELKHYNNCLNVFNVLPPKLAQKLQEYMYNFFRHMVFHATVDDALFNRVRDCLGIQRPTNSSSYQLLCFENVFTYLYTKSSAYRSLIDFLLIEKDKKGRSADADWARHALAIYEWKPTVLKNRPNTYLEWLEIFCQLFGRKYVRTYEPNKLKMTKKRSKATDFLDF